MGKVSKSKHVFISYSHADADIMNRIKNELNRSGISVWTDEGLIPGTESWKNTIEGSIRDAVGVIVILSPSAKQSQWVENELGYAGLHGVKIFPVLVRGEPREAIPIELINSQWLDLRNEANFLPRLQKLVQALEPGTREDVPEQREQGRVIEQTKITPPKRSPILFVVAIGVCVIIATSVCIVSGIMNLLNGTIDPTMTIVIANTRQEDTFTPTRPAPGATNTPIPSPTVTLGCVVTINEPFVALMKEPDTFSQQLIEIPPGEYPMLDYRLVEFAGSEHGWFMLEVEGRIGWVENNIFNIQGKTSSCP